MSILIKGVSIPKEKNMIVIISSDGEAIVANGNVVNKDTAFSYYGEASAVEIEHHGDLIDRDELETDISRNVSFVGGDTDSELKGAAKIINRIYRAKAVIEGDRNG